MSDDTSVQAVEELIGELPEGVEVPPEVAAMFAPGTFVKVEGLTNNLAGPPVHACVICGEKQATLSPTGRCPKCKSKRLPNNTARIGAASASIGYTAAEVTEERISTKTIRAEIEAKNAEIAALRAALNNAQPLTFSDFKERVTVMRNAGVESYEDRGVRIVMKSDISTKRNAAIPLIE